MRYSSRRQAETQGNWGKNKKVMMKNVIIKSMSQFREKNNASRDSECNYKWNKCWGAWVWHNIYDSCRLVPLNAPDSNLTAKQHWVRKLNLSYEAAILCPRGRLQSVCGKSSHSTVTCSLRLCSTQEFYLFSRLFSRTRTKFFFLPVLVILHQKLKWSSPARGPSPCWRHAPHLYAPVWLPLSLNEHSPARLYAPYNRSIVVSATLGESITTDPLHNSCQTLEKKALHRWRDKNKDLPIQSWHENRFSAPCRVCKSIDLNAGADQQREIFQPRK